jgi:hypothetical protein
VDPTSSLWRRRTLANDELRTQELTRRVNRVPVDNAQKHFHAAFALQRKIMVNSGERRLEKPRLWKVVVTDHGNVLGYLYTLGMQGPEHAQRHMVVGRHDRGEPVPGAFQQPVCSWIW